MTLPHRVQERMRTLASSKARVLCAVSGGPDSVALAHILRPLPYTLFLGHVDHQMRKTSGRDSQFVESLAKRWQIPFETARVVVTSHAAGRGRGLEEAARDLRYQALINMARQWRCSVIVTAHTADDQAETILMNFLRGSGPAGLAGIPISREVARGLHLIRPMLESPRSEVLGYLKEHRLASRQDPSNRSLQFTRNRIRRQVLPLLEKEYPGLKGRLAGFGEIFREEQGLWAPMIERELNKTVRRDSETIAVDLPRLLGYHKALGRRILRHFLTGISFQDTERIFHLALSPKTHLSIQLSGGLQVERKGKKLIIPRDQYEQS